MTVLLNTILQDTGCHNFARKLKTNLNFASRFTWNLDAPSSYVIDTFGKNQFESIMHII